MDLELAMEHARQVSREVVWYGLSDREAMTRQLSAYRSYLLQGVEGTFTQLLAARGQIDEVTRQALEQQFPSAQLLSPAEAPPPPSRPRDVHNTTALRREDFESQLAEPNVSRPVEGGCEALAWLECEPLAPVPVTAAIVLSLGRDATCDLVLPHQGVSRHHAEVRCEEGRIVLEDGSTFGTFVNGEKVSRETRVIEGGDVIAIGPYIIVVREDDPGDERADTLPFRIPGFAVEAMHGKLSDVSLAEVLQQIEFNEKTGTLRIMTPRERGVLCFCEGRPQWAEFGAQRDEEAVYRMLGLAEGEFSFVGEQEPGEQTLFLTVTGLLMEFSRKVDEG